MKNSTKTELVQFIIDQLKELNADSHYGCDLHNEIFNTDYYIIGYYNAEQWLIADVGVFSAISTITDYETDNFGQVSTDLTSSEKVCNMLVYIYGEQILGELETLREHWNSRLSQEAIDAIIEELESI